MTRINCGIPVTELADKHLLAEAREIKRIPNAIAKGRYNMKFIPVEFVLGKGHVSFFYDKLLYLFKRYQQIHTECLKRGFNVQNWSSAWENVPVILMNDYVPNSKDAELVRGRIKERLNSKKCNV